MDTHILPRRRVILHQRLPALISSSL